MWKIQLRVLRGDDKFGRLGLWGFEREFEVQFYPRRKGRCSSVFMDRVEIQAADFNGHHCLGKIGNSPEVEIPQRIHLLADRFD